MCSEDKKEKNNPDCPINCLFINNGIMKKGVINETAILIFYDKFGLGNPGWKNITADSLQKCLTLLNDSKSFFKSFEKFEKCMNEDMQLHCIEGKDPEECDKVENFMQKCQNVHIDCEIWPRYIVKLPELCCSGRPELFTAEIKSATDEFCKAQDIISNLGQMQCRATRMLNETGIKSNGKWNFSIAEKLLIENSRGDAKWKKAIEKTVETCEKKVVHG